MSNSVPRILCVDDEPRNLDLLDAMLSPRGYQVVRSSNGPDALARIRTERIDLCLLDVMMPGMNGFEVCRRIKSDAGHGNIPVIMLTADTDSGNRLLGIEAGAEDFISKPMNSDEVFARMKMLLHVKARNDLSHAAHHNIAKLGAFCEQMITCFDPARFNFLKQVDSIVHQIMGSGLRPINCQQIVVIGMVDPAGACQWLRYDVKGTDIARSTVRMKIDYNVAFSDGGNPAVVFYNNADADLAASALAGELKKTPSRFRIWSVTPMTASASSPSITPAGLPRMMPRC